MKLIFDKNELGADEIKALLPFLDADIKFSDLKPYIKDATNEIIKIIGKPMYDVVQAFYMSPPPEPIDEAYELNVDFLENVQSPIILDAYRHYAIDTDLAHTGSGRLNRVEENQRIAFEWQIEKSNKSLERKYYKAIDNLIEFMDGNIPEWKDSEFYAKSFSSFVRNASTFDLFFNIESSRLLLNNLTPGLLICENNDIIPLITKERFDAQKAAFIEGTGYDSILVKLIQEATVYSSLAWGIPRMSAQLFPDGLFVLGDASRLSLNSRKSVEANQAEALAQRFQSDAQNAFRNIEKHIQSLTPPVPNAIIPDIELFNPNDNFVDC
jgi:hypothetical protein